jgi:Holliday junction DNA helicase RuvA
VFAFLHGTVAIKAVDHVALDVHGVGYAVHVPEGVQRRLAVGQEVTLLTYCHIREDAFQIFGFLREEERALFMSLLSINKVGPKVALSVLSALPPQEFARAVMEHDVKAFRKAQGVGTSTAQRIILEMNTKLKQEAELSALLGAPEGAGEGAGDDVFEALLSLGCTPQEARRAAAHARRELGEDAPPEELVRVALRSMARSQ